MSIFDSHAISTAILVERGAILAGVAARQLWEPPAGVEPDAAVHRQAVLDDANFNLSYLAQAIALESLELYQNFAGWLTRRPAPAGSPSGDRRARGPRDSAGVIARLAEHRPDVLVVSATISCHFDAVAELIRAVRKRPDLAAVRILVGGRAFNRDPKLWRKLGADGWAANTQQAIVLARCLVGGLES